ncbi:bifunctional diguanylate cyclase/phosphodiesterase [Maricaulis maris]|uniref:PAS domain S-box-containing protein/diguanylate cyclase (GGDEF)-like protein n=1 Tax=Maricaulis maris TaxID=74318 RepID=A0A495DDJ6_9PROT|nr:EAL domain-containing protein [Maricaulis maris]RKR00417.1 PAS domain S-box-containing protein/diguanylate cyclase (GGDEF)-like protein [Maricaulis maris]
MYRVYYCLTVEHDLGLVAVAALLCALSALAAVSIVRRAKAAEAARQPAWLLFAGFVTGTGIWGTHFVSMLAYESAIPVSFGLFETVTSFLLAVIISSCGWAFAVRSDYRYASAIGGGLVGGGVAAMHFVGVAAMRVGASVVWDAGLVIAALALGVQFAAAAGAVATGGTSRRGLFGGAALLVGGVVSLHFLSMSAMELVPDFSVSAQDGGLSPKLLAITIALGAVFVVSIGLAAAAIDQHLGLRRAAEGHRIRALAEATFEGIAVVRDGLMHDMNGRFCEMLKLERGDLVGMPVAKLALDAEAIEVLQNVRETDPMTCRLRCRDGAPITVQVRAREMDFDGLTARIFAFRDVSSEERARARMVHLAHHDTLTGLPNRLKFREAFEAELRNAWDDDTQVALMFFDLDRFKEVNDVHGHAVGDRLLVAVSERLLDALPRNAVAARLSGDEFAVVLPDVENREDVLLTAQRVVNNVGSPLTIGQLHLKVSASGGVTMFPMDGEDPDRLMNQADLALYRAKGQGRNQVCDFDPKLGLMMQERRMLEADLALAIDDDLLTLNFQPQVRLGDGRVSGFEALVRWHDERRGNVPPSEFVQIAEETGLILKMGEWVLETACREAVNWPDERRIAVNVSPAQFKQGNLVYSVQRALAKSGLAPQRLEIEITEGVLIDDEARALKVLRGLKDLGVGLAIDDFGTGYSSLSYLRAFPFDKIKIDRSFMTGLQNDPEAQIIVRATIDLARELNINVVVEGIEEFDELGALGFQPDLVLQGYLLSRPLTRGQIAGFDEASKAVRAEIATLVGSAKPLRQYRAG